MHEGFAGIFGTYIEALLNGETVDSVMGDDEDEVAALVERDLENPEFPCLKDVPDDAGVHDRGVPFGHWFYLVSSEGAGTIPMAPVIPILLEALQTVPKGTGYEAVMQAVMDVALGEFGACSEELAQISNGWNTICVPTGFQTTASTLCNYSISGPASICEQDSYVRFCATTAGPAPNSHFRFYIVGRQSTEFDSECGMQGNSQEGCNCLTLTEFRDFPYYPQTIQLALYNTQYGPEYKATKRVTIRDCNGDKPTCEEYFNQGRMGNPNSPSASIYESLDHMVTNIESLQNPENNVYISNSAGQVVFQGKGQSISSRSPHLTPGFYFVTVTSSDTELLETQKLVVHD